MNVIARKLDRYSYTFIFVTTHRNLLNKAVGDNALLVRLVSLTIPIYWSFAVIRLVPNQISF